jgi:hypothetical protein
LISACIVVVAKAELNNTVHPLTVPWKLKREKYPRFFLDPLTEGICPTKDPVTMGKCLVSIYFIMGTYPHGHGIKDVIPTTSVKCPDFLKYK